MAAGRGPARHGVAPLRIVAHIPFTEDDLADADFLRDYLNARLDLFIAAREQS
jgi:hypothetical protein